MKDRLPYAEYGGKIILPPAALDALVSRGAEFPLLFKLCNAASRGSATHVGVLEFVAENGRVYVPRWIMQNLGVQEGHRVRVENVALPVAEYTRLQPQSVDFLDITNPKAVLENAFRNFSCLTTGDIICIHYNDNEYKLKVLSTRPGGAVKTIECDMEVDFEKPLGYVEETPENDTDNKTEDFVPFSGKGYSLSGKKRKFDGADDAGRNVITKKLALRGIPDFEYKIGTLIFMRNSVLPLLPCNVKKFTAFQGKGRKLKQT